MAACDECSCRSAAPKNGLAAGVSREHVQRWEWHGPPKTALNETSRRTAEKWN